MKRLFIFLLLIGLIAGCTPKAEREAMNACKASCTAARASVPDFFVGPCLAQEITPGWACDVTHNPRQPIDDDPRNQCASYRDGVIQNQVELDIDCEVISTN